MAKICHLLFEHTPLDGRIFYKEAVSLAKAGFAVTLLVPSVDKRSLGRKREVPLNGEEPFKKLGVEFEYYHYSKRFPKQLGIRALITKKRILQKLIEIDADVYHFHEDGISMEVFPELKKLRPSKKTVYDFHEFFLIKRVDDFLKKGKKKKLLKYLTLEREIATTADVVITVSDFLTAYFKGLGARKVVTIMNCQSRSIFRYPAKTNRSNKPFFVCHEGRMIFDRGLELIVEIMRNITDPEIKCLIIGSLHSKEQAYFEQKTRKYGIRNKFVITGWLDYLQVPRYLSQAHLGLFFMLSPNGYFGVGNKFFNYLCFGLPVISLSNLTTDIILNKYRCGYSFRVPDPKAIAAKIVEIKQNQKLYETLSANSRLAFEKEFNWERMETLLIETYRELFHN